MDRETHSENNIGTNKEDGLKKFVLSIAALKMVFWNVGQLFIACEKMLKYTCKQNDKICLMHVFIARLHGNVLRM